MEKTPVFKQGNSSILTITPDARENIQNPSFVKFVQSLGVPIDCEYLFRSMVEKITIDGETFIANAQTLIENLNMYEFVIAGNKIYQNIVTTKKVPDSRTIYSKGVYIILTLEEKRSSLSKGLVDSLTEIQTSLVQVVSDNLNKNKMPMSKQDLMSAYQNREMNALQVVEYAKKMGEMTYDILRLPLVKEFEPSLKRSLFALTNGLLSFNEDRRYVIQKILREYKEVSSIV